MRYPLQISTLFFAYSIALAQLLPLEMNHNISLPAVSDIWDVLPHPDGYYLWVAAAESDTERTRIYWGSTLTEEYDSLDLDTGTPKEITCFWNVYNEACVVLSSQKWFHYWYGNVDSTLIRIYRLSDGRPDSAFWLFLGTQERHPANYYNWDLLDHRALIVALNPPPPLPSQQIRLVVSYSYHSWGSRYGSSWNSYTYPCFLIENMLHDATNQTTNLPNSGSYAVSTLVNDTLIIVYVGRDRGSGNAPGYPTTYSSSFHVNAIKVLGSGLDVTTLMSCSESDWSGCSISRMAITCSSLGSLYCFLETPFFTGVISNPPFIEPVWTVASTYDFWLCAEVIEGNDAEELLAYNMSRGVFDVFNAANGYYYGISDTILNNMVGARIVARYDSVMLRLVVRDQNYLKLYRFGRYLHGGENRIFVPKSFYLSSFPNPFNPSTTISFSLPREAHARIAVFDILGREVAVLADERFTIGEHRMIFDGASFPSGIYFGRLQSESNIVTHKLLLLK